MKRFLVLLLCGSALGGLAQVTQPEIRVLPEDVVQTSITVVPSPVATNRVAVLWTYTDSGAKKMMSFWRAHAGEKVLQHFGDYYWQPTLSKETPTDAWLERRTDKFVGITPEDAKKIVAGLKEK